MPELPTGTVTFLFTDIEGSTRLLHELGDAYADALTEHRSVLRDAFERHGGVEVDTQGDAFFVAFARASDALAAAREGQEALASGAVRVRMGLHTGEPVVTAEGYVGVDVHRAARIAAAGHGGQILVSQSTRDVGALDGLRDLGEHRLKDLAAPERIYQLGDGDFPPLKSLNLMNLPLAAEPLLGRKKELAAALRLVRQEQAKVVTFTGPGGIGKTRFALEAAAELVEDFSDGVWFVGLAPLRDPELVVPTIAGTLGAKNELRDHIGDRELLLLLDNFEQVVDAAGEVAELLSVCPRLVAMVTSREPLHIAGEREYQLLPLAESPGVELFRQRASAVVADFDGDYAQLAEICHRLDSLPLAIELAAARVKLLSPTTLLARLDTRLPLLTSRRRDADERHRTLRATIEWSYDLLGEDEKRLFACLAVFAGSFDDAAVEQVCDADLNTLESLVDKSLLRQTGDGRLFMLETIWEYAHERLEQRVDASALQQRHADFFLRLAEEAEPHLDYGESQIRWLDQLEHDRDNLRAAITFLAQTDRAEKELRLVTSSWRFWWAHGYVDEIRRALHHALARSAPTATPLRAKGLVACSYLEYRLGGRDEATRLAEELLAAGRQTQNSVNQAKALHLLALVEPETDRAVTLEMKALELAGDDPFARDPHFSLGYHALLRGDLTEAKAHLERTQSISDEIGDRHSLGGDVALLALTALKQHEHLRALSLLKESIRLHREVGDRSQLASLCAPVSAAILLKLGEPALAVRVLGAAERTREELGSLMGPLTEQLQETTLNLAREGISVDAFSSAWAEGRGTALETALSDGLASIA